jgi:predicted nucleic acid-binding protein
MSAEYFLDTNILIYHIESSDPDKAIRAGRLIRSGIETGLGCISFQVIQECLNTVLRKAEIALTPEQTLDYLNDVLVPLYQVPATLGLYRRSLDIQSRYRYGFYDSLIIASALEAGCTVL